MKAFTAIQRFFLIALSSQLVLACGDLANRAALNSNENGEIEDSLAPYDVNRYQPSKLVCDPFDPVTQPGGSFKSGVSAELYYLKDDQPRFGDVADYIELGQKSTQNLFFSEVNVPTRLFTEGFPTETGDLIQNDEGEILHEYFALKMTADLVLRDDQEEGLYELALLSDDGAIMKLADLSDEMQAVVDNDGKHPTRFGCGDIVEMKRGEAVAMELLYYQGPRRHISVIPMWRKVESLDQAADPLCGVQGNSKYFDFNNNSEPKQGYLDLLARGWEPIQPGNYRIADETGYNPCNDEQKPEISEMYVIDLLDGGVRVTWKTDIPATSQVMYTSSRDGVPMTTNSDNVLRTLHSVEIPDPVGGESFIVRAISVSATMGRTISGGITYRDYGF